MVDSVNGFDRVNLEVGIRRAISVSNSVGRANFHARTRAEGLEGFGGRPAGVRMEFEAGEGKKFVGRR